MPVWATLAARYTGTSAISRCFGPASIPRPCAVAAARRRLRHDPFVDFCTHGKRAYYIASTIPSEDAGAQNDVLERLSQEFEICAYGLNEARKEWERREPDGPWQLVVFD